MKTPEHTCFRWLTGVVTLVKRLTSLLVMCFVFLFLRFGAFVKKSKKLNISHYLLCHVQFSLTWISVLILLNPGRVHADLWTVAQKLDFLLREICIWASAGRGKGASAGCLRFLLCGGILKQGGTGAESHLYVCLRHCSCRPLEAQAGVKYSSAMPKYLWNGSFFSQRKAARVWLSMSILKSEKML